MAIHEGQKKNYEVYLYPSDKLYNYFVKTAHSHVTWAYNMHHLTHTSYYGKYIAYVDCKSGSTVK